MNFLLISPEDLVEYSVAFDYLGSHGYNCYHSDSLSYIPDVFFDFYIIDEERIHLASELLNTPYLINIKTTESRDFLNYNKNFLGFIDLKSNPIAIRSFLKAITDKIHVYNDSYTGRLLKERFSDINMNFFETLPHGLLFMDYKGEVIESNHAAEEILNLSKGQLTGVTAADQRWVFYQEDGTILKPYNHPGLIAIRSRKEIRDYILGISHGDSDVIWLNVDSIPIIDKHNQSKLTYIYFRDITKEKKEHENMELFLSIFKNSTISIVVTDAHGIIESVNPKFLDITGYTEDELVGQQTNLLKSALSDTNYEHLWETITSGETWTGEFTNKRKNGEIYSESAVITPLKNSKGQITHYIGLKEDISDLKMAQMKLETTLKYLEDLVVEKTTSLKSAQALTLESLATLSEYRDNETGAHIKRTKLYVKFMLEQLKDKLHLTEEEIFQIWSSAPLHDIGKVAIPDSILLKNGKLTTEEFEIMKGHVRHGNEALVRVSEGKDDDSYLKFAKEITLFHHERWDGSGYPYGLVAEDIPISARLMALADVYDALRSTRPYKDGIPHEKVVEMINEESGLHFDPVLVEFFSEEHLEFDKIFLDSVENKFDLMEY